MHLTTRNVNTAFIQLIPRFLPGTAWEGCPTRLDQTRNGKCLVVDEPVLISYTHPKERVLFNPVRDANPFFHLYESLWMLAGRNDLKSLAYYCSRMKEFSDDGKT